MLYYSLHKSIVTEIMKHYCAWAVDETRDD
jgi:hypothetical protein